MKRQPPQLIAFSFSSSDTDKGEAIYQLLTEHKPPLPELIDERVKAIRDRRGKPEDNPKPGKGDKPTPT